VSVFLSRVGFAIFLALLCGDPTDGSAQDMPADEIMERNFLVSRVPQSTYRAQFKLENAAGQIRIRDVAVWSRLHDNGIDVSRLSRFMSPADIKGTATLVVENFQADDGIWLFLPAIGKVRRLAAANKRDSYVGTDLSYADIVGFHNVSWSNSITGDTACGDAQCWVIESMPKSDAVAQQTGYGRRVSHVRKTDFVADRGEFFDLKQQLIKTFQQSQIQHVASEPSRFQAMHLQVKNHKTGHTTTVELSDFKTDTPMNDSLFSPSGLESQN